MKNKFVVLGKQEEVAPVKPSKEERIIEAKKKCLEEIDIYSEAKETFLNSVKELALFQLFSNEIEYNLNAIESITDNLIKGGDNTPQVKQARRTLLAKIIKQYDI